MRTERARSRSRWIRLGEEILVGRNSLSSIFCLKIAKKSCQFFAKFARFVKISLEFVDFLADFYRNFTQDEIL